MASARNPNYQNTNDGLPQDQYGSSAIGLVDAATGDLVSQAANTVRTVMHNGKTIKIADPLSNLDNLSLISASNVSTSQTSPDQTNFYGRGVKVFLNATAIGTGALIVLIQYKDPVSGQYITALTSAAVIANGLTQYTIYPGIAAVANVAVNDVVPRTWRVQVTGANSSSFTVGGAIIL